MNPPHPSSDQPESWRQLMSAIDACWPAQRWCNLGIVVGVSGGADSVALLRGLCDLRGELDAAGGFIVAAHFHHGLRGSEADRDAQFVQSLAADLGVRHQSGGADLQASDEATMRGLRAAFLRQAAQTHGARYVVLAHTVDDNVETFLHHLMRGTGPKGLAGIPQNRALGSDPIGQDLVLMRPLLGVRRQLIRDGLRSIGQDWCEDSSNVNTDYRRNWIRHELLPLMETKHPQAIDAIARAIDSQSQWKQIIDRLAQQWIDDHVTLSATVTVTNNDAEPAIMVAGLQEIWLRQNWPAGEMSQEHWSRLVGAIQSVQHDRFTLPGGVDARVDHGLTLSRD